MNAIRKDELSMHCTCTEETGQHHPAVDTGESNCVQLTLAKPVVKPRKARNAKLGKWLLALAVISATTLYTICHPNWVPSLVAQPVDQPVAQSVKIAKKLSIPAVRPAAPASSKEVDRSAAGTKSGAHRALAAGGDEGSTEIPKAVEAKPSKSKDSFLVPPPPPTPVPPGLNLFPMQPDAASLQQLQQAQAQDSTLGQIQSAAREITPQQSDPDLQNIDQELEAAMRSSQLRGGQWKR